MQTTSQLLMIRPVAFAYNDETAVSNKFQKKDAGENIQKKALHEFDQLVSSLRDKGIRVLVVEDTLEPHTPDSIFPNNWVSFHEDGTQVLYPMEARNRRAERDKNALLAVRSKFKIRQHLDLRFYESDGLFLEGTGSMVLDREHKIAYACLSPRTSEKPLRHFSQEMGYSVVAFHAVDEQGELIYHTNVMMCIADHYSVACLEAIRNPSEREIVEDSLKRFGKTLIPISLNQMHHFAGNMLQVKNTQGEKLLIMSTQAFQSLLPEQVTLLKSFNKILHTSLTTIETNGGGSARCMLAEIHLPPL